MAAIVSNNYTGRIPMGLPQPSFLPVTINGNGVTYVQGAGNGLPFDITTLLNGAVPPEEVTINPADVIGIYAQDANGNYATNGSLIVGGTAGSVTYNTTADITGLAGQPGSNRTTLSACPCLVRIFASGGTELAGGAYSGVLNGYLMILRGGKN